MGHADRGGRKDRHRRRPDYRRIADLEAMLGIPSSVTEADLKTQAYLDMLERAAERCRDGHSWVDYHHQASNTRWSQCRRCGFQTEHQTGR